MTSVEPKNWTSHTKLEPSHTKNKVKRNAVPLPADLMTRAAEYAREAAEVFASMQPQDVQTLESFAFSLYWVVLNFATLCRLGGGGQWTANQACAVAAEALAVAHSMVLPHASPPKFCVFFFWGLDCGGYFAYECAGERPALPASNSVDRRLMQCAVVNR